MTELSKINDVHDEVFSGTGCKYLLAIWGYNHVGNKEESLTLCNHPNNLDDNNAGCCSEACCPIFK